MSACAVTLALVGAPLAVVAEATVGVAPVAPVPTEDLLIRTEVGLERISADGTTRSVVFDDFVPMSSQVDPTGAHATFWGLDGTQDIFTVGLDGTGFTDLTSDADSDSWPSYSPDGSKIIFTRYVFDDELFVMDADGTDRVRLTNSSGSDGEGRFSPDGSRIVFRSQRSDNAGDIWVMDADGTDVSRLTTYVGIDTLPDWSPDGTRIAFMSNRSGSPQIWLMNADGTDQRTLTTAGFNTMPAWSPDGTAIAYSGDGDLRIAAVDGSYDIAVTATPSTTEWYPDWIPGSGVVGPATWTVTTGDDTDDGTCSAAHCSLREAITATNTTPNSDPLAPDTIIVTGVTVTPTSPLPTITEPVVIDGGTAPDCAGSPSGVIDGSSAGAGASGLTILGGNSTVRGVVVVRWASSGVLVMSEDNVVECSHVGIDAAGTTALPNMFGINLQNGSSNLVGGLDASRRNILSGNSFQGVRISGGSATRNRVQGNYIGTDITGTVAVGNNAFGGVNLGGTNNLVGGDEAGARNVISGNGGQGVFMPTPSSDHTVVGNWIGVDATGNAPLGNGSDGVFANGASSGGSVGHEIRGNVISANGNSGVQLSGPYAVGSTVEDNLIGVGADGVTVLGNHPPAFPTAGWGVIVGGSANVVRHNTIVGNGTGVAVGTSTSTAISGVTITENSIHDNGALGIDLANDGVTANDAADADTGPNRLQNTPAVAVADADSVDGSLDAAPTTTYVIETFASPQCDPSGSGEGAVFLASTTATTDGSGHADWTAATTSALDGLAVTATATAPDGSTSEFSVCTVAEGERFGRVRIVKETVPAGGTGFTFAGPAGATPTADGPLTSGGPVVVYTTSTGGTSHIEVLDLATNTTTSIAGSESAAYPTLSPDGNFLAFGQGGDLRLRSNATGSVVTLPDGGQNTNFRGLTWSPDGRWLAWDHAGDIWAVGVDGAAQPVQLTTDPAVDTNPAWGPDGRIAFRSNRAAQRVWVGTFDATTGTLTGLTGLANSTGIPSQQREMDWSSDGASLVAAAAVNAAEDDDLYLIAADGTGGVTQLTTTAGDNSEPSWEPGGSRIVFSTPGAGGSALYVTSATGAAPSLLLDGPGLERSPDWGVSTWFGSAAYTLDDGDDIGGMVRAGDTVEFTELADPDWYVSAIDCGGASGAEVDVVSRSVSVTVADGDDIVCTFINTELATLTVAKETVPDGDPTEFGFSGAVTGSIADGETISSKVRPGTHTVAEDPTSEFWRLSSVICDDSDSHGNRSTRTATFVAGPGEDITCTFTNQGYGRVTIAKTTDPGGNGGFPFTGPALATPDADRVLLGADMAVFTRSSSGLFALDIRSGELEPIPGTAGAQDPELSPDSEQVAYAISSKLFVRDLATGQTNVIVDGLHGRAPSWSPDGAWIVFHANDDLYVVPSDGSAPPTQLTSGAPAESFPTWGPDGRIAWRANTTGGNIRVATFDPSTTTLVGAAGLPNSIGFPSQHRAMHWSPDGSLLAAGGAVNAASDTDLYILAGDGSGGFTKIVDDLGYDTEPTFTADGTHIVYRGSTVTSADLLIVPADGSTRPTVLLGGPTQDLAPSLGSGWTARYTLADGDAIGGLVPAGETVVFTEGAADHWWLRAVDCGTATNAVGDRDTGTATFTPAVGEELRCTFENEQLATIAIEKVVDPDSVDREFSFTGDITGTISPGGRLEAEVRAGTHTVTEDRSGLPYWITPDITCDDTQDESSSGSGDTATFRTSPGEAVTCVFHNIPIPALTVVKRHSNASVLGGFTSDPITVQPGDRIAYRVEVTNVGDGRADDVVLQDEAPDTDRTTIVAGPDGPRCDATLRCAIRTLLPGETAIVTYTAVVDLGCDVYGTRFADNGSGWSRITGSNRGEVICGFGGGDTIQANGGDDIVWGDYPTTVALTDLSGTATASWTGPAGNDSATASTVARITPGVDGSDTISGGSGDDVIRGQGAGDRIDGDGDVDIIFGGDGPDTIFGGPGADTLHGNAGDDTIEGEDGNDHIAGQEGVDRLGGGAGHDTMYGGDDRDHMDGDTGNDIMVGEGGDDVMNGGSGIDVLRGADGDDVLRGGGGGDELAGGPGSDTLLGENDDDWLHGDQHGDILKGGSGNDLVSGDEGDDFVYGEAGNDNVSGDSGDDHVFGDAGHDRVTGGSGNDVLFGGDGDERTQRTVRNSHPLRDADRSSVPGGIHGEGGDDRLHGGAGLDALFGGPGHDRLQGGPGADWLQGGDDNDVLWGDDASQGRNGGDGQPDGLEGNDGNDSLYGQRGDNITTARVADGHPAGLFGGEGADWIVGGPDDDDAFGGPGSDGIVGGNGKDRLAGDAFGPGTPSPDDEAGSPDHINGEEGKDLLYGQGGHDTLGASPFAPGSHLDDGRPGTLEAQLQGGAVTGGDVIHGGHGNDRLDGGAGASNILIGADDTDFCSFGGTARNPDVRDRTCEQPSAGTTSVAARTWAWATFR